MKFYWLLTTSPWSHTVPSLSTWQSKPLQNLWTGTRANGSHKNWISYPKLSKNSCRCHRLPVEVCQAIKEPLWGSEETHKCKLRQTLQLLWRLLTKPWGLLHFWYCVSQFLSQSFYNICVYWISRCIGNIKHIDSLVISSRNICPCNWQAIFSKHTGHMRQKANPIICAKLQPQTLHHAKMQ